MTMNTLWGDVCPFLFAVSYAVLIYEIKQDLADRSSLVPAYAAYAQTLEKAGAHRGGEPHAARHLGVVMAAPIQSESRHELLDWPSLRWPLSRFAAIQVGGSSFRDQLRNRLRI